MNHLQSGGRLAAYPQLPIPSPQHPRSTYEPFVCRPPESGLAHPLARFGGAP